MPGRALQSCAFVIDGHLILWPIEAQPSIRDDQLKRLLLHRSPMVKEHS
jgi:hypothetical protein